MNHFLKQRLLGATALVIFIAVIVPLILNGNEEKIVNTENLVTEKQFIEGERRVIELDLYRDSPIPENSDSKLWQYFSIFNAKLSAVWDSVIPLTEKEESGLNEDIVDKSFNTGAIKNLWSIQLGSFVSLENARKRIALLRDEEYNAYVTEHFINGESIYKVKIGTNLSEREAKRLSEILLDAGHENQIALYE